MQSSSANSGKNNRGELAIIRHIRSQTAHSASKAIRLGIGDDCALLRPAPGQELAVTTDLTIAGTHFRLDWHTPNPRGIVPWRAA